MKRRNNGKRALTAVGAVVAAGLTPGFIAATPGCLPVQGPNTGITAADVVAIDGTTYSFDEFYAMQRVDTVETIEKHDKRHTRIIKSETVYENPRVSNGTNGDDETVYRSVEQMPQFPGGEAALMKYIDSQINYPPEAAKNNIEGRVVVQFVVKKDGSIGEVKVVRSVEKDLDKEAIRVIKALPEFTPGRQDGKAVSVWYTLPVSFKLK